MTDLEEKLRLPISYFQSYPFPAFIISRSTTGDDGLVDLQLLWNNTKIDSEPLEWSLGKEGGHSFGAWIDGRNGNEIYTLSFGGRGKHMSLVKALVSTVPPDPDRCYYVITALSADLDTLNPTNEALKLPSTSQRSPSHSGDQWTLEDIAPPPSPTGSITDCLLLLESTDWSKTALGPRSQWCPALKTMVAIVMSSPTQDSLWMGPNFNMIYNQHYTQITQHPLLFGQSARVEQAWGPVWNDVSDLIDRCMLHGEPCFRENDLLLYHKSRSGHYIERYHTWSFVPIYDDQDRVIGMYNPTRETTSAVVASRRQETLRILGQELQVNYGLREYFDGICSILERNSKDVPFALLYAASDSMAQGSMLMHLEGKVGVPDDHQCSPATIAVAVDEGMSRRSIITGERHIPSPGPASPSVASSLGGRFHHSNETASWPIDVALSTRHCVIVEDCSALIGGIPIRQWDHLPESAVIIPIGSTSSLEPPRAVLILGLNIRSPMNDDYQDWLESVRHFLTGSFSSTRVQETERRQKVENERMEKSKTIWFQGAAHDLRSPLTLVAGPLDDVLRTNLDSEQRQLLRLANQNLTRVQRLVNSLLDFSRIEAGALTGQFVPVDLSIFVQELATLFRPAVEKRPIEFEVEIQSRDEMVLIDPSLFETVIMNLLSNALKYTEVGTIKLRLSYDTSVDLSVSDTGCGIPATELALVTDRFHRATSALSRGIEGTGIGLALVKEIVKLHGGELLITSRTDEEDFGKHGSTFTVTMPVSGRQESGGIATSTTFGSYGRQMLEEALQWASRADISEPTNTDVVSVSPEEIGKPENFFFDKSDTLLLVDDNKDMRQYIKRLFAPHCKVIEATDGQRALDIARTNPPQLILSDLMMPNMNGQQLLAHIRADPKTRLVPVVLLSAATNDELRVSALTTGAEDFMLKPFKPKELLARSQLHMQIGKTRAQLEALYSQREQEIALLSDYCPSGIIRANADGQITYTNAAWKSHAGMSDDEDHDLWPSRVDQDTEFKLLTAWEEILKGDETTTTLSWKWANGTTVTGTFIRLDRINPKMSGILGCVQDISYQEEKVLDAERRQLEAEEAKRQQEHLVDLTSHEIRTPISAILQCSSLVRENLASLKSALQSAGSAGFKPTLQLLAEMEEDLEALDSIYQCGLVQERIASDILSLARVQLNMLSINETEIDIEEEARKVASMFASEAKVKQIEIALEFGDTISRSGAPRLLTDHVRVGQVITNLMANAIRFTAHSDRRLITVRYDVSYLPPLEGSCDLPPHPSGQNVPGLSSEHAGTPIWLFVSVKDTGPGLKPSEQAIIFERFVQGNNMIHSQYGGSGLGLYICRRIVELLGGRVSVESEVGRGTEFKFFIRSQIPPGVSSTSDSSFVTGHEGFASTLPIDPNSIRLTASIRVLVVEDNVINQTVLKRQLIKQGWECNVANNGEEALNLLHVNNYDVVLMDLEMPVMNGLTAIKRIRDMEGSGVKQLVIALTGNARQGQINQALDAGMDEVVIKPYKLKNLIETILKAIGQSSQSHILTAR